MLVLYLLNIFFFAYIGFIWFRDTNLGKPKPNPVINNLYLFDSLLNSFFSLFALQTTTNFPDIMLDVYQEDRSAALFFVVFMIVQFFTLMNMMAGVYYFNYKNVIAEDVSSAAKKSSMVSIVQKFISLENFNKLSFEKTFTSYLKNPDFEPEPPKRKTLDILRTLKRNGRLTQLP